MLKEDLIAPGEWLERARSLKEDGWWFSDLAGLDLLNSGANGASEGERFHLVAQFLHQERKERLLLHIPAPGEPPTVPSITGPFPGAAFFERETYDLFGIVFDGHENLSRIMMPDEWEGHPLRKDYGVGKVKVEFLEQPLMQIQSLGQSPAGERAEREVDELGQVVGGEEERGARRWRPAAERKAGS